MTLFHKSQKSMPPSQWKPLTFPHIMEQDCLFASLSPCAFFLGSAVSVNGGGQTVSGSALPWDGGLSPVHPHFQ